MAINKTAKGTRIELKARKQLEALGYLVERKNYSKFGSPDFYSWFDLLAVQSKTVRFIQIKSNASNFYTARKEIKKFMIDNNFDQLCEIWLYISPNKWRISELHLKRQNTTYRGGTTVIEKDDVHTFKKKKP